MLKFDKNIYLCNVGGFRQIGSHNNTSLSSFDHSDSFRMVFFISGSSQILPIPQTEKGLNSNLLKFQYLGKASFSNDLPVSTKDLQTTEFFAANAFRDMQERNG